MKNKLTFVIIGLLIGLTLILFLIIKDSKKEVLLEEIIDKTHSKVLINNKEGIIYSNIFSVGDKLEVEYKKVKSEININKIKYLSDNKENLVSNISSDITLKEYVNKLKIDIQDEIIGTKIEFIDALPIILNNQLYDLNLTSKEFVDIKYKDFTLTNVYNNTLITFSFEEEYEVLNFKNDTTGDINYSIEDSKLKFNSVGEGIYELDVKFKNGDVIKYIFK